MSVSPSYPGIRRPGAADTEAAGCRHARGLRAGIGARLQLVETVRYGKLPCVEAGRYLWLVQLMGRRKHMLARLPAAERRLARCSSRRWLRPRMLIELLLIALFGGNEFCALKSDSLEGRRAGVAAPARHLVFKPVALQQSALARPNWRSGPRSGLSVSPLEPGYGRNVCPPHLAAPNRGGIGRIEKGRSDSPT
jgi:hypothetical protein